MYGALGIANSMWWRGRWVLIAAALYLGLLANGIRWFPQVAPVFFCTAALALVMVWANLLNILIFGPADFGSKNSGFPSYMLVLPLRVRSLAGWPMLYGIIVCAVLWCLPVMLVLYPANTPLPLVWPAVLFAAVTTWIQAMAWAPFPTPLIRTPILVLVNIPIALLTVWGCTHLHDSHVSFLISVLGTLWIAIAYVVGVFGLSRGAAAISPIGFSRAGLQCGKKRNLSRTARSRAVCFGCSLATMVRTSSQHAGNANTDCFGLVNIFSASCVRHHDAAGSTARFVAALGGRQVGVVGIGGFHFLAITPVWDG